MKISTCRNLAILFSGLFFLFFIFVQPGSAQSQPKSPENKRITAKGPGAKNRSGISDLHVISDQMVAQQSKSMIEFSGSVKVTRDDGIITADSVMVLFQESDTDKGDKAKVKEIVAKGNVEFTSQERKAFADRAVYTIENEVLVLTGKNPRVLAGNSWVTGKKITLFKLEDRIMVESGPKTRVQAFFDSRDQDQNQDQGGNSSGQKKKTDAP